MPAAYAHLMITEKTIERINDTFGNFEKDVFSKAVHYVMRKWTLLSEGVTQGDLSPFLAETSNCDLDTGRDFDTGKFVYW